MEGHRYGVGPLDITAVDRLQVDMRFSAVSRITAASHQIACANVLARMNSDAALLKVTYRDHDTIALDEHMITGELHPARLDAATLSQRVADRGQSSIPVMIRLTIVHSHDHAPDRSQHRAPESRKSVNGFRVYE